MLRSRLFPWFAVCSLGLAFACLSNRDRALQELASLQSDSGMTPAQVFEYQGEGCAFRWRAPEERGFTDFVLSEDKPVNAADGTPKRVRLGLVGGTDSNAADYADPTTQLAVTWDTNQPVSVAEVRFGKSKTDLTTTRKGYSLTIPPPSKGLGTTDPPTYVHEVHLCGLEPATTYHYQVGGGGVWSDVQSFTTVPTNASNAPILVSLMGDARDDVHVWETVQRRMKDAGVSVQIFSGDLVLTGTLKGLFETWLDQVWKDPQKPGEFITLGQQLMVMVGGNHESASSQFYGMFAIPGDGPHSETYGSFNVGSVHFVLIDDQRIATDRNGPVATAAIAWLKDDLERANKKRAEQPFIIAVNHRPEYSTSKHRFDGDVATLRETIVPIFDQYGVDAVFSGHDHEYERSKPLRGGDITGVDPKPTVKNLPTEGTTYFVSGGAGAEPYGVAQGTNYYMAKQATYGGSTPYTGFYSIISVEPKKITISSRGMKASSSNVMGDELIDELVIQK